MGIFWHLLKVLGLKLQHKVIQPVLKHCRSHSRLK